MRSVLAVLAGLTLFAPSVSHAQVACGDLTESGTVSLTADLDCTAHAGPALVLTYGRLRLNGFTVRGGDGVVCGGACKVLGPGTVEQSSRSGIWSNLWYATRYTIAKVTIRDNAEWGIAGYVSASNGDGTMTVRDSIIETNGLSGIFGDRKVTVIGSTVRDNGTANGGAGVTTSSGDAVVKDSTIADNRGPGVYAAGDARVVSSAVTGNDYGGVAADGGCTRGGRASVVGSTVTGNSSVGCLGNECADVGSCALPRVARTSCDTSLQAGSGFPGDDWNVCALD